MDELTNEPYCYLTTRGRRTGAPHTVEIWFGVRGGVLYLLSGGGHRSDWVRNLLAEPSVAVRIGSGTERRGHARLVEDAEEDAAARLLLAAKYQGWSDGQPLSSWASTALAVAIDLDPA